MKKTIEEKAQNLAEFAVAIALANPGMWGSADMRKIDKDLAALAVNEAVATYAPKASWEVNEAGWAFVTVNTKSPAGSKKIKVKKAKSAKVAKPEKSTKVGRIVRKTKASKSVSDSVETAEERWEREADEAAIVADSSENETEATPVMITSYTKS